MARRLTRPITTAAVAAAAGYRCSPGPERVVFGISSSAALTIAGSRTLNYVRERRRAMPRVRNLGRLVATVPASNAVRVHHFLPGMAIGFAVAAASLLARAESLERWLSLPLGVGLALTTDELPLLYGRSNPYWGDNAEHFALAQGAAALLVSLGLGARFLRRGLTAPPDAVSTGPGSDLAGHVGGWHPTTINRDDARPRAVGEPDANSCASSSSTPPATTNPDKQEGRTRRFGPVPMS